MVLVLGLVLSAFAVDAYPVSYTTCGTGYVVNESPERVITLNQGATEFMFALGLADKMVGTAYLDDYIWPKYAADYVKIPVLSSSYPNETTIMSMSPDFLVASYNSAFRQVYNSNNRSRGIFSNATIGPCVGEGSEWDGAWPTCRPQLHANGIGTYLFADACEDTSLRPPVVTEATVYSEMRELGSIFNVDAEPLIQDMKDDFDAAAAMVQTSLQGAKLRAVWLDCVGRCCKNEPGDEPHVYVGAGSGAPAMLMREAGLENVFAGEDGNWECVKESEVIAANPDVIVVVDAAWDTALSKITWLYNHSGFCEMDALKGARIVHIPFSATTLGPRNGPAALDLAIAAIHVRTGAVTSVRESGVGSFNPRSLELHVKGLTCSVVEVQVLYDEYPVSYTTCGTGYVVSKSPERVITLNQGATEFMFALGLADKMVGTAYLDDYIWPKYAADYAKIPILSSSYPNETTIMSMSPDFLVASYNSAFRQVYNSNNKRRGIFSNATIGPCVGDGSEWDGARPTCRPQLHANGIGTYLFADACEDTSLRPPAVTEETVYSEMRELGRIFNVDVEPLIQDMKDDFDAAAAMVQTSLQGAKLRAVWLDCVGRCCKDEPGDEPYVYVGAGSGAPAMLMREAGLENVFADEDGNWECVKESAVIAANPDVIVVVDAAWDTALSKITWLYNHSGFCEMDALKGARIVYIPFSATTLGPRNGPAALDLAIAAIHVRTGALTSVRESGVGSYNPRNLELHVEGLSCTVVEEQVLYDAVTSAPTTAPTTAAPTTAATSGGDVTQEDVSGCRQIGGALLPWAFVWVVGLQW